MADSVEELLQLHRLEGLEGNEAVKLNEQLRDKPKHEIHTRDGVKKKVKKKANE